MIISELPSGWVTASKDNGTQLITMRPDEQRELLEALARVHGFTLVDSQERRELRTLVDEALDEHPDDAPVSAWRTLAKTLASTVADALRLQTDEED